jgi:hypothetical protein
MWDSTCNLCTIARLFVLAYLNVFPTRLWRVFAVPDMNRLVSILPAPWADLQPVKNSTKHVASDYSCETSGVNMPDGFLTRLSLSSTVFWNTRIQTRRSTRNTFPCAMQGWLAVPLHSSSRAAFRNVPQVWAENEATNDMGHVCLGERVAVATGSRGASAVSVGLQFYIWAYCQF